MRSWERGGRGGAGPGVRSLPCALRGQGMKARNLIHARIEENIRAKICGLRTAQAGGGCKDALQLLIEHSWERGERLDMQVGGNFRKRRCGIWSPGFPRAVPRVPQSARPDSRVGRAPRHPGRGGGDPEG